MNLFQERLKSLLDEHKLSHIALARILKIHSSIIDNYFRKNYYPEIQIALKMADFFKCSLDFLFGLSDNKAPKYDFKNKNHAQIFFKNFSATIKAHKIPISTLMHTLNMSVYNYYRWRDGQMPKTANIVRIAEYFDISVDYLLFHE